MVHNGPTGGCGTLAGGDTGETFRFCGVFVAQVTSCACFSLDMVVLWNNAVGLEQSFFSCLKSHASLRFGSSVFESCSFSEAQYQMAPRPPPGKSDGLYHESVLKEDKHHIPCILLAICSVVALPGFFSKLALINSLLPLIV